MSTNNDGDIAASATADQTSEFLNDSCTNFVSKRELEERMARQRRMERQSKRRRTDTVEVKLQEEEVSHTNGIQQQQQQQQHDSTTEHSNNSNDDDDDFDMFSESPILTKVTATATAPAAPTNGDNTNHQQDWDDDQGYFKVVIGETIDIDASTEQQQSSNVTSNTSASIILRISGIIGKGVFSNVLKCNTVSNTSSSPLPPIVAAKFIRSNDTMSKAAQTEIFILQRLQRCPGIVSLLLPTTASTVIEHRGHVILVFEYMEYNLRDVLQKFGHGVGLSLTAVRSYFGQLLAAAVHMQSHGIIHADLKPENILVSEDFSTLRVADFGSAYDVSSSSSSGSTPPELTQLTPYLVSRYYRAPEIILGITPLTFAIDLWSLSVTVTELFLGTVVFNGGNNNDMLYVYMQHLGYFPNRIVRQHIIRASTKTLPQQFQQQRSGGSVYNFIQQTHDTVTGTPIHKMLVCNSTKAATRTATTKQKVAFPLATPLWDKLVQANKSNTASNSSMVLLQQFYDVVVNALHLDPTKRMNVKDVLQQEFFTNASTKK